MDDQKPSSWDKFKEELITNAAKYIIPAIIVLLLIGLGWRINTSGGINIPGLGLSLLPGDPTDEPTPLPTLTLTSSATITPTSSPTPTFTPSNVPSSTPTNTTTPTPSPTPPITDGCLPTDYWTPFGYSGLGPRAGCWIVDEFEPVDGGVLISIRTPLGSGEQQRGFYTLLDGNVDVIFTLKIIEFETAAIETWRYNLAFGILEGDPQLSTFNGNYLFYNASDSGGISNFFELDVPNYSNLYEGNLVKRRTQEIKFSIRGNQLNIYIDNDEVPKGEFPLTFREPAFYFGYRLFSSATLSAEVSDLWIGPPTQE